MGSWDLPLEVDFWIRGERMDRGLYVLDSNEPVTASERFAKAFARLGHTSGTQGPQFLMQQRQQKAYQDLLGRSREPRIEEDPVAFGEERKEVKGGMADQMRGSSQKYAAAEAAYALGEKELGDLFKTEANAERELEDLPRKEYVKEASKNIPKFLNEVSNLQDTLPTSEASLKMIQDAFERGDTSGVRDRLADITGFEGLRTTQGAEMQSAVKNYFLSDLQMIKGRPNMLIEKNILDSYPKMGRDLIANQKILSGLKMKNEIARTTIDTTRELENMFMKKQGYLPPNFDSIVKEAARPKVDAIEKRTIDQMESLNKFQRQYEKFAKASLRKGEYLMLGPEGDYVAVGKSEYEAARDAGYLKVAAK